MELGLTSASTKVYTGISAAAEARQHNGDVINNYSYKYNLRRRRSDETLREDQRSDRLLRAAAEGQLPRVRYLIQLGADLDHRDDEDLTALHHAVLSGFEDCVSALIAAGADVNATSEHHGPPLLLAERKERVKVAEILLQHRARAETAGRHCGSVEDRRKQVDIWTKQIIAAETPGTAEDEAQQKLHTLDLHESSSPVAWSSPRSRLPILEESEQDSQPSISDGELRDQANTSVARPKLNIRDPECLVFDTHSEPVSDQRTHANTSVPGLDCLPEETEQHLIHSVAPSSSGSAITPSYIPSSTDREGPAPALIPQESRHYKMLKEWQTARQKSIWPSMRDHAIQREIRRNLKKLRYAIHYDTHEDVRRLLDQQRKICEDMKLPSDFPWEKTPVKTWELLGFAPARSQYKLLWLAINSGRTVGMLRTLLEFIELDTTSDLVFWAVRFITSKITFDIKGTIGEDWQPIADPIRSNGVAVIQELISRGVVVNKFLPDATSPLAEAASDGSLSVTKLLVEAGADPSERSSLWDLGIRESPNDTRTAFEWASKYQQTDVMRYLEPISPRPRDLEQLRRNLDNDAWAWGSPW